MTPVWLAALQEADAAGRACVLVTLASVQGSAPREAGAKMVVTRDASYGTIGGGRLEFDSIAEARLMLMGTAGPLLRRYPLGPALGQCCGGAVSVLFEVVAPPAWEIALFGAGHVGRAIANLLADLPCQLRWIDQRTDLPGPAAPTADPVGEVARLASGTTVLVMTHDHQLDFDIVAACLARADLASVGLIGSNTKRARFVSRLRARGLDPARLICPIGVPGAGGKLAAEIAISVVAQLLQLRSTRAEENWHLSEASSDPACTSCAVCM